MSLTQPPRFVKRVHHIVPDFWQNQFAAPGKQGPYYKNISTNKCLDAQGPGDKMAVRLANIVFDEYFRPSDALEDRLGKKEAKISEGLRRVVATSSFDDSSRCDVAMLLALQACRYPEKYSSRLDLGKHLAIALQYLKACPDVGAMNRELTGMGMPVQFNAQEFEKLTLASDQQVAAELTDVLARHGYEADFNAGLIIDGAGSVAEHILGLQWTLLSSTNPQFILSDHPVPYQIKHGFSVSLSASLALTLSDPAGSPVDVVRVATPSTIEIDRINLEMRSRAIEWICGPGDFVHHL